MEQERQTAALSYILVPLAFSVLIDIGRSRRSEWARRHARHAVIFGSVAVAGLVILAAIPLMIVSYMQLNTSAILVLYSISFVIDLLALTAAMIYAFRMARGAARGEVSRF